MTVRGGRSQNFGTSNGKWSTTPNDYKTPELLRDVVGTKGKPKSIGESVMGTNPRHSPKYSEYSKNCQRCVVAYELRRRGYDVEALAAYKGNKENRVAHIDQRRNLYNGFWKGAFRNGRNEDVSARTPDKVIQNIEKKMQSYGSGSRAVIQVFWKGGGGHVFNIENDHGRIVWVEAQSGRMRNPRETMSHADTSSVNIVRTDNLRISDRIREFVGQSKNLSKKRAR